MATILIVDDEKSMRMTLREFLQDADYRVVIAGDAEEAGRAIECEKIDVVLSDIVLPGVNGIQLLRSIRSAAPEAQVILMTGQPTLETASQALRLGAADYLLKPFTKAALLRSVGNAIRVKTVEDEKRQLEAANREYRDNLERLVQERTGALQRANQSLQETMAQLREAHAQSVRHERLNALGQLAAGIAHDFNNTLMPILGLTEYLVSHRDQLRDETVCVKMLTDIRAAALDAKEIVRRMREFYRPHEEISLQPISLAELFRTVAELTRPKWKTQAQNEGRRITLTTSADESLVVAANLSQIREVLINLVLNAADAMPAGGAISLTAAAEHRGVVIHTTDTGAGMPPEICKRCFEPFFTTKGEKGSGMGLAMAHGIIGRHGGTIDVVSDVGKGTDVIIRLPLREAGAHPAGEAAAEPGNHSHLHILVIDDEEWSRSLLSRYLRDDGHTVETAVDGATGLQRFRDGSFDAVITDRSMPGMNGDALARAIRDTHSTLPILMLTGDSVGTIEYCPDAVSMVLEKPVTQRELKDAMAALFR